MLGTNPNGSCRAGDVRRPNVLFKRALDNGVVRGVTIGVIVGIVCVGSVGAGCALAVGVGVGVGVNAAQQGRESRRSPVGDQRSLGERQTVCVSVLSEPA